MYESILLNQINGLFTSKEIQLLNFFFFFFFFFQEDLAVSCCRSGYLVGKDGGAGINSEL